MKKYKLTEPFLTINQSPLSVAMRNEHTWYLLVNAEISGSIIMIRKEERILKYKDLTT